MGLFDWLFKKNKMKREKQVKTQNSVAQTEEKDPKDLDDATKGTVVINTNDETQFHENIVEEDEVFITVDGHGNIEDVFQTEDLNKDIDQNNYEHEKNINIIDDDENFLSIEEEGNLGDISVSETHSDQTNTEKKEELRLEKELKVIGENLYEEKQGIEEINTKEEKNIDIIVNGVVKELESLRSRCRWDKNYFGGYDFNKRMGFIKMYLESCEEHISLEKVYAKVRIQFSSRYFESNWGGTISSLGGAFEGIMAFELPNLSMTDVLLRMLNNKMTENKLSEHESVEIKEEKWAIAQEQKENKKYKFHDDFLIEEARKKSREKRVAEKTRFAEDVNNIEEQQILNNRKHEFNKDVIEDIKDLLRVRDYEGATELLIEQQKYNRQYEFYKIKPSEYKVYCYFLIADYCYKYDFGPVFCRPRENEYGCSWKDRKMPDYMIKYNEEIPLVDIIEEKRLTMFGEYYYEKDRFNLENYEDMLDFYENIIKHIEDD